MSTKIDYVDESWNPVIGCSKIATGCKNCYAEKMAWRLAAMEEIHFDEVKTYAPAGSTFGYEYTTVIKDREWNGNIVCRDRELDKPFHWRKPRRILVPSMGDLFHEKVPFEFIDKVFEVMSKCSHKHKFYVLTKRPKRMADFIYQAFGVNWRSYNIWLGTSISMQADADKNIPELLKIPGSKWLSIEPMIEGIFLLDVPAGDIPGFAQTRLCDHLHWVVVGCESGASRREFRLEWAISIIEQCKFLNIPCYVKQIPIDGKVSHNPEEWPENLRRREFPNQG